MKFERQRWMFRAAKKEGWQGVEPSILGTPFADRCFDSARRFLLDKVSYSMAGMWFSGTCMTCKVWWGKWLEHDSLHVVCPSCGALQAVSTLQMNEAKQKTA